MIEDQGLPASVYMEVTILGAMLMEQTQVVMACNKMEAEDFHLDSHQKIFSAIKELFDSGRNIDYFTVRDFLEKKKELGNCGGPAYLASLTDGIPRNPNNEDYIRIVRDKAVLRNIMRVSSTAFKRARSQEELSEDILKELGEVILNLAAKSRIILNRNKKRELLVDAINFSATYEPEENWMVEKLIQRGGNGLVLADPGVGKSLAMIDLAIHLASGTDWLECRVVERVKTAIISREDFHGETAQRIQKLVKGGMQKWNHVDLEGWLYLNTRAQTETMSLDNDSDVDEIIDALREKEIKFAIFDVFRRLWKGNENDNEQVTKVLAALTRIQTEAQCAIALVHHVKKADDGGSIFHRQRGSSAIEGWREWAFGFTAKPEEFGGEEDVRKLEFYTKSGKPHKPIFYEIEDISGDAVVLKKRKQEYKKKEEPKPKKKKATDIINGSKKKPAADKEDFLIPEIDHPPEDPTTYGGEQL